jgi:hypothetical protein
MPTILRIQDHIVIKEFYQLLVRMVNNSASGNTKKTSTARIPGVIRPPIITPLLKTRFQAINLFNFIQVLHIHVVVLALDKI